MTIVGRAVERTAASSEDRRDVTARAAMLTLLEKLAYIRSRYGSRENESLVHASARFLIPVKRRLGFEACHGKLETSS